MYLINKKECNKSCNKFQNEDDGQSSHELVKRNKKNKHKIRTDFTDLIVFYSKAFFQDKRTWRGL